MELKDTIEAMNSGSFKERMKAEYWQTKIRYEKLKEFNNGIEAEERMKADGRPAEHYVHTCPSSILREQQAIIGQYLHILEVRAKMENIDLKSI